MNSLVTFVKKIHEDEQYNDIRETLKACNEINEAKKILDEFERSKLHQWKTVTTSSPQFAHL